MKMTFLAALAAFIILTLTGCGSDHNDGPQLFVSSILSDANYDGDIKLDFTGALTIAQGNTESVFAGIDPINNDVYRAFLDFPLAGANGVPGNAIIDSAYLEIFINSIEPQPLIGTIPVRVDLVSFQPPFLVETDFDRTLQPALATVTVNPPISSADFGQYITIDVTSLMIVAQRFGHLDFQVRILDDLGDVIPGLIEISDTTGENRSILAPLLTVNYF